VQSNARYEWQIELRLVRIVAIIALAIIAEFPIATEHAYVHACMRACVRACVRVCVCVAYTCIRVYVYVRLCVCARARRFAELRGSN